MFPIHGKWIFLSQKKKKKKNCHDKSRPENFILKFQNFIHEENLSTKQIYHVDEMVYTRSVCYQKHWHMKLKKMHKKQKQCITVLCYANVSGSHILDLCVIGTAKKLRGFSQLSWLIESQL